MTEITCISCDCGNVTTISFPDGKIHLCKNCRIQWGEPQQCSNYDDVINSYYHNPKSFGKAEAYPPYLEFFSYLQHKMKKQSPSEINILDIGCGSGIFIQECQKRGYSASGIEASLEIKPLIPAEVLPKIIFKPVQRLLNYNEQFDVITFWDSFEHIPDAFTVLNMLRKNLKQGGFVYIRVNNVRDIYNYVSLSLLRLLPEPYNKWLLKRCFSFPYHVWNFSKDGITGLLAKNNWKIAYHNFTDTPALRLTNNKLIATAINAAYIVNKLIRGGKIGNYYIVPLI
ncbi:class I SAM-dependent methyltransferase [Candidatus Magnetominusculus dajiuhuensis]|uniref:class I SAM-dependent methyltransferase n=1 Tax=Candidatus Magnetominusculus dajiuhuensis TaxID=3137712 RepID=UPI003B435762